MSNEEDVVAYAREVYAACLTVGFVDEHVTRLKPLLDLATAGPDQLVEMVALARAAQSASVAWASRGAMLGGAPGGENDDA